MSLSDLQLPVEVAQAASPVPSRRPAIFIGREGLRAGWSLLIYLAILAVILFTVTAVAHRIHHAPGTPSSSETRPRSVLINEGILVLTVAFATFVMSKIEARPLAAYGIGGTRKLPHFLASLAWGAAFLSLLVFTLRATGLLVIDRRLLFGESALQYGLLWLAGFLLVALFEEYFMRGYLQFTLARGLAGIYRVLNAPHSQTLGFWTAALLLSVVFGLGHKSNAGESPLGIAAAGLVGLVFCLSLWRTGSLWWAIGFHASWDWAQSFLYGVADSGTMVQFHLLASHAVGKPLLSGGATGPEGSIFILPIFALITVVILTTLPRTRTPAEPGLH